jgi:hypothetical protein
LIEYESLIKNNDLIFYSAYESGNLFAAYKIDDEEKVYDLILQNDINSKGNT